MIENPSIIRENRKTIKIIINEKGNLVVFSPINLSYNKIENILKTKKKLLEKKLNKIKNINLRYKDIIEHKKILLVGEEYFFMPTEKVEKVYITKDSFLLPKKYIDAKKEDIFIKKTCKELCTRIVGQRVKEILSNNEKIKINKLIIGDFKSKWGSCDSNAVIKLNWRIIMLSPKLIDFVLFHEITHLKELNHSKKFYENLEHLCPTWKDSRDSLKEFSFLLSLY